VQDVPFAVELRDCGPRVTVSLGSLKRVEHVFAARMRADRMRKRPSDVTESSSQKRRPAEIRPRWRSGVVIASVARALRGRQGLSLGFVREGR